MSRLPRAGAIGLDTSIFIYFIEETAEWVDAVDAIFELAATGARKLVTSQLTLSKCLVVPYRAGDLALAERYEDRLCGSANLTLVPIDRANLRAAAQLRAVYGLKTPDAIQIAAALRMRCSSFITNDRRLPEIPGLRILQLSELR